MGRVPIILVTGYLGAGKTTLVNQLLRSSGLADKRVALIVNEFGALGVDGALIDSERAAAMYEINSGSLFCSCVQGKLIRTVREIVEIHRPDVVLVEATGVAVPSDLLAMLGAVGEGIEIHSTVAVIDARTFPETAAFLQAASQQVAWADGVVINKTDLADASQRDQARMLAEGLNPTAPIAEVCRADVPWEWVASLSHRPREAGAVDAPPAGIVARGYESDGTVGRAAFEQAVRGLGARLLRLKGNIDFGQGSVFVEWAGGELIVSGAPAALGRRPVRFTAIAWDTTPAKLDEIFWGLLL